FVAVVVQFGLIVLIVDYWQLESLTFLRVMQLAFVGFVIHHLLPLRFRLPFFAALSLLAVVFGLGKIGVKMVVAGLRGRVPVGDFAYSLTPGLTIVVIGVVLIGICHLPIRFRARVGLVAVTGAGLAIIRGHSQWFPDIAEMWVILGSMFMFRLMIYLYD